MRTLIFLLKKEFRQIRRNKAILLMVMVMPVIQLIILPLAADYEIKNIHLTLVDHDHSTFSTRLAHTITASGYFQLQQYTDQYSVAYRDIEQDKSDLILEIPAGFERNLVREHHQTLFIAVNAINGVKAGLGASYLSSILQRFNQELGAGTINRTPYVASGPKIKLTYSNWYNPHMSYRVFMVPAILSILITMVGGFLSALNIVREKETGTIEQINVTPIKKHLFILGKLIPFWILGNIVFTLGLVVCWVFYGILSLGSLFVLYGFVWIYLLAVLGFGLLISTYSHTQQQAMLIMFFFMMIFILMGGLFTPIESMPHWAQIIARLNPVSYFVKVIRMVMLKGSGWQDILPQTRSIGVMAIVLNLWAVLHYKKVA
ncbi:MAG TPA: ABC transporter permease [Arachidicoccus sp.]|nr:ABC transporter permease [Arachidicoccus sp.]